MSDQDRDDLDFMSEIDAMKRMKPVWSSNLLLFSITLLVVAFITWASVFKIEEIIRGSGHVVPSSELQLIQSLEGGILAELFVQEGDRVEKGQKLARIRNVAFASEERGIEAQIYALKLKEARLQAEGKGHEFTIDGELKPVEKYQDIAQSELDLYASRQEELSSALEMLEQKVKQGEASMREVSVQQKRWTKNKSLLAQELSITRKLAAQNAVPKLDVIRLQREMNSLQGDIEASKEKLIALEAELDSAKQEVEDQKTRFRSQSLKELTELQMRKNSLQESLNNAGDRVDRTLMRAPVTGIVKAVNVKTIGGVIQPAMALIEVVPIEDELLIKAQVKPEDIAFLRTDLPVKVKISAYDPQRYGAIDGKIIRIGADSVEDKEGNVSFEIDVRTEKSYLGSEAHPLPIMPGMTAEAEVITGKRSIMTYLLKPVLRARDRALTEK